jgi:hypothetical protein
MDTVPLDVSTLPGIIAGPILRRLTRTRVSLWVALTRPQQVTLHVRPAGDPGGEIEAGSATPVKVGTSLWIAVVTGGAGARAAPVNSVRAARSGTATSRE